MQKRNVTGIRSWAAMRTLLGLLQMIGAMVSFVLLMQLGVSELTILACAITTAFTSISIVLFRILKIDERGSWMTTDFMKKNFAEFLGTFALVFAGTGAIIINETTGGIISHVGVALTFGLIVLAMIYAIGDVSGAHLNPAVTLGFWAARRFEARHVLPYVVSQCLGALAASLLLRSLFPQHTTLGATIPAGTAMQSFIFEFVLTAILMFVILSVSTGAKERGITAGIAIGAVIALEALFAGPICGASMNPARSLAPGLISGQVKTMWIYLSAPTVGALLAVLACRCAREEGCCCSVPHDTTAATN